MKKSKIVRLVKVNFYSKVWNRFPQTYKDLICYIAYRFAGVAAYRLGGKILKWHMSSGHMQHTWPVNSFEMTNGVNVYSFSSSSKNQAQIPLSLPPPLFVSKLRKPIIKTHLWPTHYSLPWQTQLGGLVVRASGKTELEDMGSDFGQYLDPGGIKEPGPQRVLYLLFGGLGLVHRSCIGLITNQVVHKTWILQHIRIHTCKYTHTHTHILQSKRLRNNKEIKKKQIRMPGILRK